MEKNESFLSLLPLIFSGVMVFQYTGKAAGKGTGLISACSCEGLKHIHGCVGELGITQVVLVVLNRFMWFYCFV